MIHSCRYWLVITNKLTYLTNQFFVTLQLCSLRNQIRSVRVFVVWPSAKLRSPCNYTALIEINVAAIIINKTCKKIAQHKCRKLCTDKLSGHWNDQHPFNKTAREEYFCNDRHTNRKRARMKTLKNVSVKWNMSKMITNQIESILKYLKVAECQEEET